MSWRKWILIGASVLAPALAQAQNNFAANWRGITPATGILNVQYQGRPSCEVLMQNIENFLVADGHGTGASVEWQNPSPCPGTGNPDLTRDFRWSDDFPTTPNRTVTLTAYCGAGSAQYSAGIGYFCPSALRFKNLGRCKDCAFGNPVDPSRGQKFQAELDYAASGPFPLRFERFYNSNRDVTSGAIDDSAGLRANWTHNYHRPLAFSTSSTGSITLVNAQRPDGMVISFALSGAVYVGDADRAETLEKTASGWKLTNLEDEIEVYDNDGRLLSISNRAGLTQTLGYFTSGANTGNLQTVTDPFGRKLTFARDSTGQITQITNPDSKNYTYATTAMYGNLASVTFPDGKIRTYRYDDTTNRRLLTGITDELNVDFATFSYDGFARAYLTKHGNALDADYFSASYPDPGLPPGADVTQLVDSGSSATRTYSFTTVLGVVRLTGIAGPVCPSCGPKTQSFTDGRGNVTSRTDWNNNQTTYSYNTRNLEESRTEAVGTPVERTITTTWHPTYRLPTVITEPM